MKILLADANHGSRQVVKKMLSDVGFKNVFEAPDDEKAWEKIEAHKEENSPVQLIIADWDLPGKGGLELLKKVRGDENIKSTKFLMITGEAAQQNVVIAVKSGVNNVVVRPFSANILMEKIAKFFGQA
ncbi:MAG: response regulator [Halobacteriovoraceae bacterium]|nr:response regulator [Halobacteriovoraceae bacterium]